MAEQLQPVPTMVQKIALLIGSKSGRNSIFRRVGEANADVSIKYNQGISVGRLPTGLVLKSLGLITWKDIPKVIIGRFYYRALKRRRKHQY